MADPAPKPAKDQLETALAAAAEAGQQDLGQQDDRGDDIAADDAGASKLAQEVDREGKLPTSHPPGKGED
jgi:hypothetical protein